MGRVWQVIVVLHVQIASSTGHARYMSPLVGHGTRDMN